MTNTFRKCLKASIIGILFIFSGILMLNSGCSKKDTSTTAVNGYKQLNLVADINSFSAIRTDTKLGNAWGIAIGTTGDFWIAANHTGSCVIYDYNGTQLLAPINIPLGIIQNGASPTGVVYNSTNDFYIPGNGASSYIFATEDGIISAWNAITGASSKTVADRSLAGAVYKGITMATDSGANFIYAADFHNAKIDVYDRNFTLITTKPFIDTTIPVGYAPFNIENIGGKLYVTYAQQMAPLNHNDNAGIGHGYVNVFTTSGIFLKRFTSQGMLNSPWGITQTSAAFGQVANAILIGNFGDGHICVYDANGAYQGQLISNGAVLTISGLWAIKFCNVFLADPNHLYFTAGPNNESNGLFGYLKKM